MWPFAKKQPAPPPRTWEKVQMEALKAKYEAILQAKYDAAQTTPENERWWARADSLGPNASTDKEVRHKIAWRSRYEVYQGNSFASGIVQAKQNDVVGTGPTLQVGGFGEAENRELESAWQAWAEEIDFSGKVRTLYGAKMCDGEGMGELINNERLTGPVQLDIALSETEQWDDLTAEGTVLGEENKLDGVTYDSAGNPITYSRLRVHPGDFGYSTGGLIFGAADVDEIPADLVLHLYDVRRPGQLRGVSDFATSLSLLAELRRYTYAVIAHAETIAEHVAFIQTQQGAFNNLAPAQLPTYDGSAIPDMEIPMFRRMIKALPEGWGVQQLDAAQPSTAYPDFVRSIATELSRSHQMPLNILLGDSSQSNFASARLDYILYWSACDIARDAIEKQVLRKVLRAFLMEYTAGQLERVSHRWFWPPRRPIDEVKAAQAKQILFDIGHLVDDEVFAEMAQDPELRYESMQRMRENRERVGFPLPGGQPAAQEEMADEAVPND